MSSTPHFVLPRTECARHEVRPQGRRKTQCRRKGYVRRMKRPDAHTGPSGGVRMDGFKRMTALAADSGRRTADGRAAPSNTLGHPGSLTTNRKYTITSVVKKMAPRYMEGISCFPLAFKSPFPGEQPRELNALLNMRKRDSI